MYTIHEYNPDGVYYLNRFGSPFYNKISVKLDAKKRRTNIYKELVSLGFEKYRIDSSIQFVMEDMRIIIINQLESDNFAIYFPESHVHSDYEVLKQSLFRLYRKYKLKPIKSQFGLIIQEYGSMDIMDIDVKKVDLDIDKHYNDDFREVYDSVCEGLTNEEANSLFIFRSEPGNGKTYLIRHLISTIDKRFIYLNAKDINMLVEPSFLPFAVESLKGKVLVIEDGEEAIKKRNGENSITSILLNMTDGLFKDALDLKIIITINCKMDAIDPALLRNGRIHTLYEFKPLNKDKCIALGFEGITKDTSLADLYNTNNGVVENNNKTIGF